MLPTSDIEKRFTHLRQTIHEASKAVHADSTMPKDLVSCMDEIDQECKSAKKIMSSRNEGRIRQCVDDLERIGDHAEHVCREADGLNNKVKDAVNSMHLELVELKRDMHEMH